MKTNLLKLISALLAISIICSMIITAEGSYELTTKGSQIPIIRIQGDGAPISDENDNLVFQFNKMGSTLNFADFSIEDAAKDILIPYIFEGLTKDEFDNYYQAIEKHIGVLFEKVRLNKDGEVDNGTGLDGWREWNNEYGVIVEAAQKYEKGYYGTQDYQFWYDWRLDPLYTADELHKYIQRVKFGTGAEKVCITSMCLGTDVLMAYIAKYGTDELHGVSFDGSVVAGAEVISQSISGKFNFDGYAITRFLQDSVETNVLSINPFITDTVDMLTKSGLFQAIEDYTKATVYDKVKEGITSSLALATFFTWPGYWAAVSSEDYETAKNFVFGKEGSEKRQEYAGLIEKLDNYDRTVRQKLPELLQQIKDSGINVAVIGKYGVQIAPIVEDNDAVADQIASLSKASFGATTSTIYNTLSEEYINNRKTFGYGKYISPDKQVDASTCFFPDSTWFIKGARHSHWTDIEDQITYTVVSADRQLTVDDFDISQFIIYDYETQQGYKMTKENCNTYYWEANAAEEDPSNFFVRVISFCNSFTKWIKSLANFISESTSQPSTPPEAQTTVAVQ